MGARVQAEPSLERRVARILRGGGGGALPSLGHTSRRGRQRARQRALCWRLRDDSLPIRDDCGSHLGDVGVAVATQLANDPTGTALLDARLCDTRGGKRRHLLQSPAHREGGTGLRGLLQTFEQSVEPD